MKNIKWIIVFLTYASVCMAQQEDGEQLKRSNVVLTIGHALIPSAVESSNSKDLVLVPTWGLSYEYRFSNRFLLGLKGEAEMSSYIVADQDEREIEREYPISLILYADYRMVKDLYLIVGPGIEFEKEENFYLASLGLCYEVEIPGGWALVPEFVYKLKGGHTSTYALGLGVSKTF